MTDKPVGVWARLNLRLYFVKFTALFLAVLAGASTVADWNDWLGDLQKSVKSEPQAILIIYGSWMAIAFAYEFVRAKLKADLDEVRAINRAKRRRKSRGKGKR